MLKFADWHTHTDSSNYQFRDSTNFTTKLIDKAIELGLKGIGITDHAVLSSHVKAVQHLKKLKEKNVDLDFTLGLGCEIYLVDRNKISQARLNNQSTKFHHLIIIPKNYKGYRALAKLSSMAWEESFTFRGVQRVPTYKDVFEEWIKENKGNVIVTTACLGGELGTIFLKDDVSLEDRKNAAIKFLVGLYELLEEDFYIELQPSNNIDQVEFNKFALNLSKGLGIKTTIATDSHYLTGKEKELHSIFLKSQNAEREVEDFYSSTHLMDIKEIASYFPYLEEMDLYNCLNATIEICDKIENFDLYQDIKVPRGHTTFEYGVVNILADINLEEYPYIKKFGYSSHIEDIILLQQISNGLRDKNIEITEVILSRINEELESLWEISEQLNQRTSSYYTLTKEIIELTWKISLRGVSRGSCAAFYICYLLDISDVNPLDYNIPSWRHASKYKIELSDIDIDTEKAQRGNILQALKEKYGHKKVLNICTFKTEGPSSAIQTICRGLGISIEDSTYLSSLVVSGKSINESFETMKDDKQSETLIKELSKFENLLEYVLEIEGICCGVSVHASGIYIMDQDYHHSNALMKTQGGVEITQYNMFDSDYQGNLKVDMLTIEALDRIKKCLDLLLQDGVIEWKGTLKDTYEFYLHPDVLDLEKQSLYENLCNNKIPSAFQYSSPQGAVAIDKIKPHSFQELMDGNALMRLVCDGEQPIDKYVKHKKDINLWYQEMKEFGLTEEEIEVMKKHLLKNYGIAATQESVMLLSMDSDIANFDMIWANKLKKAIAKASAKGLFAEVKKKFFENSKGKICEYVWEKCILPQMGYAFSDPHICGYTLILAQELTLIDKFGSLYWNAACLCVDSGDISKEVTKGTDYAAVSKAISNMEKGFVLRPSINTSKVGFKVLKNIEKVRFGLGAINGISMDLARVIIECRPFISFEDFLEKCYKTKIVSKSKTFNLIKAGCFMEFEERTITMDKFINLIQPPKEKLTTANLGKAIDLKIIPITHQSDIMLYKFKKEVFNKKFMVEKDVYKVDKYYVNYFLTNLEKIFMDAIVVLENGGIGLDKKVFDKIYKNEIDILFSYIKSDNALNLYNKAIKKEIIDKYCSGSLESWDMQSLGYYPEEHEFTVSNLSSMYNNIDFFSLDEKPQKEEYKTKIGQTRKRNKLYTIAGVVVDKNRIKSKVTLYTEFGIVDLKMSKDMYSYYDKREKGEKSWFERGSKLLVSGYRLNNYFFPRVYFNSLFSDEIYKIEIRNNKTNLIKKNNDF